MILSVPSLSGRIARDRGTTDGHVSLEIHRHDANSAVSGFDYGSCDVFAVEGLILFDVHVAGTIMAALTGPSAEPSFGRLCTRVPSRQYFPMGFLNNGYRNFRLAASTSSSVVANLLRCKLDCINRRDTRSVHPSVDDPRPYVCGLRQPGRLLLQYATFDRAISSHFARTTLS
ncbi:hypothetical protein EVAR_59907_1 [Eumeta japonica]|uniref:Uncharacterized protein n=1 Tax=Eumeta variegata TaxID=151549 RepID=A0A4C2ACA0_EUMVA|nr:hypothetical protein EVAR_59907_1 [Eumeta japonica]